MILSVIDKLFDADWNSIFIPDDSVLKIVIQRNTLISYELITGN